MTLSGFVGQPVRAKIALTTAVVRHLIQALSGPPTAGHRTGTPTRTYPRDFLAGVVFDSALVRLVGVVAGVSVPLAGRSAAGGSALPQW